MTNPNVVIADLLLDLIDDAIIQAEAISEYSDAAFDPHCRALDDMGIAAAAYIPEDGWQALAQTVMPVHTPWWRHRIWISPRTQHCLDHVTPEWGDPIRNVGNLVTMVMTDQHHLAKILVHPDDAGDRLGMVTPDVLDLVDRELLSYVKIEGITFILDDEALARAAEDLDAWTQECGG